MRIYFSSGEDPMLVDSLTGMNETHNRLQDFLLWEQKSTYLPADCSGSAEPYQELLHGFEIVKSEGPLKLSITNQRNLLLAGSVKNLLYCMRHFKFDAGEEGEHHHPEYVLVNGEPLPGYIAPGTLSLIIEVDSEWIESMQEEN
jgi:hypothetical protein